MLFEWHSLGNIELSESYLPVPGSPAEPYDYVHPNSVALDADGNIWLSARHTWTVYKIDHETGAMYWRLGGKRNNFDIASDAKFSWQHDARPRGNGVVERVRQRGERARRHQSRHVARIDPATSTSRR